MVGEKELFPPGMSAFSVSDTAVDGVVAVDEGVVVADGVVVVEGPSSELLQPAVRAPIMTRAAAPADSVSRRIM